MPRNRQKTEQRILAAARCLLAESGFEDWGVNRIARESGVDKVLLYRYYGSLEGLLETILRTTRFWPDPDTLPDQSAESFIEETSAHLLSHPEAMALLSHSTARHPQSSIRRKFNADLDHWLSGFRSRTRHFIQHDQLELLPALIQYQASTGRESLSARDIWKRLSPPLEWADETNAGMNEELPIELL